MYRLGWYRSYRARLASGYQNQQNEVGNISDSFWPEVIQLRELVHRLLLRGQIPIDP